LSILIPGKLAYIATEGAIGAFTITLAAERIILDFVDPSPTNTCWMTEELKQELLLHFPMGRIGQPEDAARLIAFLASEDAG
jgi:3-oxoacyl-[acyl-carrier protein] reductase